MIGNNAGAAGYTASHCGANLIDDGSNVRVGGPTDGVVTSIKLIFSKPVNDVSIVASWFRLNDAISVTLILPEQLLLQILYLLVWLIWR